jgi:hypothetical protein
MIRLCTTLFAAALALAATATAQIASDGDPMVLAYNYGYTRAICDSATPRERAQRGRTDTRVNCQQADEFAQLLKRKGYWCNVPCTPELAKKTR